MRIRFGLCGYRLTATRNSPLLVGVTAATRLASGNRESTSNGDSASLTRTSPTKARAEMRCPSMSYRGPVALDVVRRIEIPGTVGGVAAAERHPAITNLEMQVGLVPAV